MISNSIYKVSKIINLKNNCNNVSLPNNIYVDYLPTARNENEEYCLTDVQKSYLFGRRDRKSTRLNSSHANISYAVFCLKKKTLGKRTQRRGRHTVDRRTTGVE